MKSRVTLVLAFLCMAAAAATAQTPLPQPQIIDHQVTSCVGCTSLTATEDLQATYNILELVVSCDHNDFDPCLSGASDSNSNAFTHVSTWHNDTNDWNEEIWYLIEPSSPGNTTITATTEYLGTSTSWKMLVEQVQGIDADQ
jgi:hypothetical protein